MSNQSENAKDAANRLAHIAQQIRGAVLSIQEPDEERDAAKGLLDTARTKSVNVRESIMCTLAVMSLKGDWAEGEIDSATKMAAAMSNNKADKSIGTFIGEARRAMHPHVRSYVNELVTLRDTVWAAEDTEAELAKASNAPVPMLPAHKAFARKYHMLQQMFREYVEGGCSFTTVGDVIEWSEGRNPDFDAAKILARLKTIRKQLEAFHADWPVDDLSAVIDSLKLVGEDDLKKVQKKAPASGFVVKVSPPLEEANEEKETVSENETETLNPDDMLVA